MDDCKDDIKKYECGKVQIGDYRDMHVRWSKDCEESCWY